MTQGQEPCALPAGALFANDYGVWMVLKPGKRGSGNFAPTETFDCMCVWWHLGTIDAPSIWNLTLKALLCMERIA